MAEDQFDVIMVGAGIAGCTAAYILANAGLCVLVVERGTEPGAKNLTGGVVYTHSFEHIFPDFLAQAPLERQITRRVHYALNDKTLSPIQNCTLSLTPSDAWTVLRGKLDGWLAAQAEDAGAMIVSGIRVDRLLCREGQVVGIDADGEEMEASAVILADGISGQLAQRFGLREEHTPSQVSVGAKGLFLMDADTMSSRFGNEGLEMTVCGSLPGGFQWDGFFYTNRDSLSVGITVPISAIVGGMEETVPALWDAFLALPAIDELVDGGELAEYGAHMLYSGSSFSPEGLYAPGLLLAGDAAGFTINTGICVRGMDLAAESGRLAAEAVIRAHEAGDFSAEQLSSYRDAVCNSFIRSDMEKGSAFLGARGATET